MSDQQYSRLKPTLSTSSSGESEPEELQLIERAPPFWKNSKKKLSKQLSMCETPRDKAWERRRRQMLHQERRRNGSQDEVVVTGGAAAAAAAELDLTDEDLNELKGSIELGFGFNEQQGQGLCNTLPALDLYFAVNRQFSPPSPVVVSPSNNVVANNNRQLSSSSRSSSSKSLGQRSSSFGSDKILSPGDAPEQVKTKLRHWAQAVACSVMQSH